VRFLFLSNFYPSFARGGYEQWCHEVAIELTNRGHEVRVLTSRAPDGVKTSENNNVQAHHLLRLEVESGLLQTIIRLLWNRKKLEQENLNHVLKLVTDFHPDAALIWGMWNIPRSVPALVEQLLPGHVAYYLCDYWLSLPNAYVQRWQEPSKRGFAQWPKQLLGKLFLSQLEKELPISLKLTYPICVSQAVRKLLVEADIPVRHAQVIHGGTQIEDFATTAASKPQHNNNHHLKLLYAGRLDVEKGVHTAIRAMGLLVGQQNSGVTLDIIGKGNPDYEAELKALVRRHNLSQTVSFRGRVPRSEIPAVFAQYDALIFPSEWEEPFARTILEAMAAGLVVIGATTGGTVEILVEGETGLTFPPGDAKTLADQIHRLRNDFALHQRLGTAGQQCVTEKFTFQRMVDQIETVLQHIAVGAKEKI
jgi:glycosyltransferase involved in cell wall biosynthesis